MASGAVNSYVWNGAPVNGAPSSSSGAVVAPAQTFCFDATAEWERELDGTGEWERAITGAAEWERIIEVEIPEC